MEGQVAKVRCRSCYHEHTYLHEQAPPSRKDLKKAEMLANANSESTAEALVSDPQQPAADTGNPPELEPSPSPEPKNSRTRAPKV